MKTLDAALFKATQTLAAGNVAGARLDAEVLLAHVLSLQRLQLVQLPLTRTLTSEQHAYFAALVEHRLQGQPVAYLIGEREFWSLSLRVTPAVLIPRPETELVVELALAIARELQQAGQVKLQIVDVGTGSGAIACAMASELPTVQVLATDMSRTALDVCADNVSRLGLTRQVLVQQGSLLDGLLDRAYHLVLSNPPYIADKERAQLSAEVLQEPGEALFAGPDGLAVLRALVAQAPRVLVPDGALILEHGVGQGAAVRDMVLATSGLGPPGTHRDLAGLERVTTARRQGSQ